MARKTRTAQTAYAENAAKIAAALDALQKRLEQHAQDFEAKGSKNWGYVGDLAHIAETLETLTSEEGC